jgi:hypothetical protein
MPEDLLARPFPFIAPGLRPALLAWVGVVGVGKSLESSSTTEAGEVPWVGAGVGVTSRSLPAERTDCAYLSSS